MKNISQERIFIGIRASNFVDRNIKKRLQDETEILFSEIEKKKTNIGAPLFYYKEKLLTSSCSYQLLFKMSYNQFEL